MNSIDKLSELFKHFPGIGPRQARRFVYYLLSRNGSYSGELVAAIQNVKKDISQCSKCQRYFVYPERSRGVNTCNICLDDTRDASLLMIVPRDVDFEAVEKSGGYGGYYFVLGGAVPILDKEPEKRIRLRELESRIKGDANLKEVILAMNVNLDGEHTAEFIKENIQEWRGLTLTLSSLGRGLSTGAELEYADPETLKSALKNRQRN